MNTNTLNNILEILLVLGSICIIIMFKTMIIDNIRFSGILEKDVYEGKMRWYIQTPFRKITLSKIFDEANPHTLILKEGAYYKNCMIDEEGCAVPPLWSIYQYETGYNYERIKEQYEESLWKFLTK